MTIASQPTVAIVLCTYNGESHIAAQLDSLVKQSWPVAVRVFDDVSTDATAGIVESYKNRLNLSVCVNAINLGYVANFEAGIAEVLSEGFDYIALCDQDDIWSPDRIAKGMQALQALETQHGCDNAVLAHSDLRMIDANSDCVHASFFHYRHYEISHTRSVATILGQNGVMGNTILMNSALASMATPFPAKLHVHDYWLAILAELHGHRAFISEALVDYRIHEANASNSAENVKFGIERLLDGKSWRGFVERDYRLPFKEDYRLNVIDALLKSGSEFPELSSEHKQLLLTFRDYLVFNGSRLTLLTTMLRAGFFRRGLRHRMRLIYSTLLTKRYN